MFCIAQAEGLVVTQIFVCRYGEFAESVLNLRRRRYTPQPQVAERTWGAYEKRLFRRRFTTQSVVNRLRNLVVYSDVSQGAQATLGFGMQPRCGI